MPKIIICLTGMPGAGKSTIVDALKEDDYFTLTLGDGVRTEAKRRNLEPTGENLGKIMLELREKNGAGAVALLLVDQIMNSEHNIVIIDGVRSNAEIDVLKEIGTVKLLAIIASSETRFSFLRARGRSDDPDTHDKFNQRDSRELGVGINDSIDQSDEKILNSGITIDELIDSAKTIIQKWKNENT